MELEGAQFWTTFFAAISAFYQEDLDPGSVDQNQLKETYDFIIVGGGTAGCVLANRLTENPAWTVLLLEAGGAENSVSDVPIFEMYNHHSDRDWNYTTVRQQRACLARDGICEYPRGRVLGGGSTINGMMYVRGNKADYDGWEERGCSGWSYRDVLPYFIKSENNTEPSLLGSGLHGTSGYQNVQYPRYITKMREEFIKAGEEFGWKKRDYNDGERQSDTVDYVQFTIRGRSRASASKAFLMPASKRKNLHVVQRAFASKIILDKTRAKGVEYYRNNQKFSVLAKKEVIIAAGAIDTPKLLMLSGIGPKEELEKHDIKLVADLPVGKSLQDHPLTPIIFKINKPYTLRSDVWRTNESIYEYAREGEGPLTTVGGEAMAFFNPLNASGLPNFQIMFPVLYMRIEQPQHEDLLRVVSAVVHPKSRGSVRLKSKDYRDPPLINPNYFGEDVDFRVMQKGLERLFDYMKTPTMAKYSPEVNFEDYGNCKGKNDTRELVECMILQYTQTVYHPVGTAKMGDPGDSTAVVTPDLMVRGFQNLRVIDASVMPAVPRANTNAPTIMVAEKGADIVKAAHKHRFVEQLVSFFNKVKDKKFQ